MTEVERRFAERAVGRKKVFLVLSIVSVAVAVGLALFYGYERLTDPSYPIGTRMVIVLLILLNARQNLRQHKYAALLEKLMSG
jgi:hypothetical protein